jgi:uncharacterized protein YjeT (DUF2065 family)
MASTGFNLFITKILFTEKEQRVMEWILYAISVLWIGFGSFAIMYTAITREKVNKLVMETDSRILSVLPIIGGILLIIAASAGTHAWFIRFLGLLALLKGALIIVNPQGLWTRTRQWYMELSDQAFRLTGIILVILGTAMMSWVM